MKIDIKGTNAAKKIQNIPAKNIKDFHKIP